MEHSLLFLYFWKLNGADVTKSQIKEAENNNTFLNATYHVRNGEKLDINFEIDLVATGKVLHWMDADEFFKECASRNS